MQVALDTTDVALADPRFLTALECAGTLGVSESWVRRHARELPSVRLGRLVRFDSALLLRQFQGKQGPGNRLRPERSSMGLKRYQRGSVYKTGKKLKMWYGMYREDVRRPDGTFARKQRNVRLGPISELPTRAAAYERLSQVMRQSNGPRTEMTFRELIDRWEEAVAPTLKSTTAKQYLRTLRGYTLPLFGPAKVSDIGRYEIESFLACQAKVYCRNTLRRMRASLSVVLSWAVDCDWISKNPCSGVKLPLAGTRVVRTVLKPEEIVAIANRLEEPYRTLVILLASSGLRIGEAVAIRWSDVKEGVLHVRRRIYEGQVDDPKTGVRAIPLAPDLLRCLLGLWKGEADGWVFQSKAGTPINPGNALKRQLRPVVRQLGLSIGGWHDFRHTLATQLMERVSTKTAAGILGHSDTRTTLGYQHPSIENFRAPLTEISDELLCDVTKCTKPVHRREAGC